MTWTDGAVKPAWWLCAWVDSDSPGYRKMQIAAGTYTIAADYQRFPAWLADIDTAITAAGWSATLNNKGSVRMSGPSAAVTWTDRLGWLCGMASDPTDTEGTVTSATSRIPPPGCIPLLSASWERVDRQVEEKITFDRWQRGHGYVWGSAELWRWKIQMVREAALSLQAGAVLSGKVTLTTVQPSETWSDTAWSSSNPDGFVDGYVVGLEPGRWLGPYREIYECSLLLAAQVGS